MKMNGNNVLITGGGSGIGLALARAFAMRDNRVIVCGRDAQKLVRATEAHPAIEAVPCDLAVDREQEALVEQLRHRMPALNVLVNNAGIQKNYTFADDRSRRREIEEEVRINLTAPLALTNRLLPALKRQGSAAIVNITSALALVPKENAAVYCGTKAGLRACTQALRYQLEGTSVRVFEVVPALVDTPMTRGRGQDKMSAEELAREALAGMARDRDEIRIGKTKILFLLYRAFPALAGKIIRHS